MIPHTSLYEQAVRYSTSMSTVVDIYLGDDDVPTYADVPVTDGKVTCDRGSSVRWTSTCEIAVQPWQEVPLLDAYRSRYRVYRGITSLGRSEMLQLGEYRVDSVGRSERGRIQINGSDLMAYVVDGRFITPRTPPYGASTIATIGTLIDEAVPGSTTVLADNTLDTIVRATAPWERDRIEALEKLADSLDTDVFCGYDGRFYIKDKPTLVGRVPVFYLNQGAGGIQLHQTTKTSRDGVYNAVSASGQSTDQSVPPVYGAAYDDDPLSPTYYLGPFGLKPRFYSSQYLYTVEQCEGVAATMLAESIAANQSMSIDGLPVCFLEAGDVVMITGLDGVDRKYLIQQIEYGLTHAGIIRMETSVNKAINDEIDGIEE